MLEYNMNKVLDINKIGAVGEYIKENTNEGATITISSPIFTIFAFLLLLDKNVNFFFIPLTLHYETHHSLSYQQSESRQIALPH